MVIFLYLLFLFVTLFLVLLIFNLTTYHAYFWKALPILFGYSIGVGYAFSTIESFQEFWLTQIWASALLFVLIWRWQAKRGQQLIDYMAEDEDHRKSLVLSAASTRAHYILSVLIYLGTFFLSILFLWQCTSS